MKKCAWIKIVVFVATLYIPWLLWYGLGTLYPKLREPFTFTLLENRNIYELEDGFENFFNDRIPFRTSLVRTYNRSEQWLSETYQSGLERELISLLYDEEGEKKKFLGDSEDYAWLVYGEGVDYLLADDHVHEYEAKETIEPDYDHWGYTEYECSVCGKTIQKDFVEKKVDTSYFPPNITANRVVRGRFDWLYQTSSEDYADFKGTDLLSQKELETRKTIYEEVSAECKKQGKEFVVLVLPSKLNVYDEYMPSIDVVNDYKRLPRLRDWMKENSDAHFACPWDELQYMDRYFPTYYRYDNHWNSFGGYIGAMSLYHEMGYEVIPYSDLNVAFHEGEETGWKGMIGFGGFEPEDFTIPDYDIDIDYRPEVTVTSDPSTWWSFYEFTSDGPNDKHLTLMGDSFREAIGPFLAKDFTRYSSILQYCWDPVFCEQQGINYDDVQAHMKADILDADVIVLEATEANEAVQFEYAKIILNMLREGK